MLKLMEGNKRYLFWVIVIGLFGIVGLLMVPIVKCIIRVSERHPKACRWIIIVAFISITKDAYVNWHCSNEHFTVEEFIIANCEYPGDWDGTVERVEVVGDLYVTATKVYPKDRSAYFHVVSFIRTANDKIVSMDEYWADDGNPPQWRMDKHIGKPIT